MLEFRKFKIQNSKFKIQGSKFKMLTSQILNLVLNSLGSQFVLHKI